MENGSNGDANVYYTIRSPWQWVMEKIANEGMREVADPSDLPTAAAAAATADNASSAAPTTPVSPAQRKYARSAKKGQRRPSQLGSTTLRVEMMAGMNVKTAVHGTSGALDILEDKDELVRTIKRAGVDELMLSPPSELLPWSVSLEECRRSLGDSLPTLPENESMKYAVLKEPLGRAGTGIFFVKNADDIYKIVKEHRRDAEQDLDRLITEKGRIPSWVVQAEVNPCLLLEGKYKFHLRSYIVVLEKPGTPEVLDVVLYDRHEVLIATVPVSSPDERHRDAHITNGAASKTTRRVTLGDCPELVERGTRDRIVKFLATTFGKHLLREIVHRATYVNRAEQQQHLEATTNNHHVRKFALAAVDMMMTEHNRIYMLEVNVNPSAPPATLVDRAFADHLSGFLQDLMDLVTGRRCNNFIFAADVLEQIGQ